MKKAAKTLSLVALCAVMIIMSVVPAFAATIQHVENHSVIDCVGQYKDDLGGLHYKIKVLKGTDLNCVTIFEQSEFSEYGVVYQEICMGELKMGADVTYSYSNTNYDFYEYHYPGSDADAVWIKLYYDYGSKHYMATGAINGSTVEGNGYWLYV